MHNVNVVIEKQYREFFGKLLAVLLKILGTTNFEQAEDIVHETFYRAAEHWQKDGLPENPAAWLMLTAKRLAIDYLRQSGKQTQLIRHSVETSLQSEWTLSYSLDQAFSESGIEDDQLRLMFWLCSAEIPTKQRLPLALKALCGLSVEAIARALLCNQETIKKRLSRTKADLVHVQFQIPAEEDIETALEQVFQLLYLLFNEGVSAHNPRPELRNDLCNTAMIYMGLLLEQSRFRSAETFGLAALMHFHVSRLPSRFQSDQAAITLKEQDRSLWLQTFLRKGMTLLESALNLANDHPSPYLLEALIAFEHCRATKFEDTDWQSIAQHYDALCTLTPSPMLQINRAVAMAHTGDYHGAELLLNSIQDKAFVNRRLASQSYIAHLQTVHGLRSTTGLALELALEARSAGLPDQDYQSLLRQITAR